MALLVALSGPNNVLKLIHPIELMVENTKPAEPVKPKSPVNLWYCAPPYTITGLKLVKKPVVFLYRGEAPPTPIPFDPPA